MTQEITQSVGSVNSFIDRQGEGADPKSPNALAQYTQALSIYRRTVASHVGITVTALHEGTLTDSISQKVNSFPSSSSTIAMQQPFGC
jgi:hypothetical protein